MFYGLGKVMSHLLTKTEKAVSVADQSEYGIKTGILKKLSCVLFSLIAFASSPLLFYTYHPFNMQFKLATEHSTCLLHYRLPLATRLKIFPNASLKLYILDWSEYSIIAEREDRVFP